MFDDLSSRGGEVSSPEDIEKTWEAVDLPVAQSDSVEVTNFEETPGVIGVPLTKNLTELPSGKKLIPVSVPESVDQETFKRVLSGSFQSYLQTGRLTPESVAYYSGVPVEICQNVMTYEEFTYALACRGVDSQGAGTITPQQDAALMILTDISSKKTWGQRLKDAGITQAIFTAWLKNPTFARRWEQLGEEITSNHSLALVQLGQQVGEGNMKAIELQLAVAGRYSAAQQASIDVLAVIAKIMDSLSYHLADNPEVLKKIANDMRQFAEAVRPSATLTSGTLDF